MQHTLAPSILYCSNHAFSYTHLVSTPDTRAMMKTRQERPRFSIIIPTLDEAARIGGTVRSVRRLDSAAEVIVVDGGSSDGTPRISRRAGALVLRSPPGRGWQCRTGADRARGEILLFLHADTRLPEDAFTLLTTIFTDPQVLVGTFRLRFDRDHWLLRFITWFTRFDSVFTRFGDQGIAVRRDFYDELGGFPRRVSLEDVQFLQRARQRTRIRSFPATVVTSSRRYDREGLVLTQLRHTGVLFRYLLGFDGERT